MALAVRLKELRLKKGKSLQVLADEVGASKAHIWDLETGRSTNPTVELLTRMADALGTSVSDLIGENPEGETQPEAIAMYRDFKHLSPKDQEAISSMMKHLKRRSED